MLLLGVITTLPCQAQLNTEQAIEAGRAAMFYDDYETSIRYFSRAIDAKPYLAEAYYWRGQAYFDLGDYTDAEEDLSRAITFNPFHPEYFQLRGLCRIHNKRFASAVEDYTNVLIEMPENQNAYFNRALCLYELKEYSRAILDLDYIIRHWPRFARAYVVKAQTCLMLNDTIQSIYWIDSLLTISRHEPIAWAIKGRYALRATNNLMADSCFTQALKYDAGNVRSYLCRAQARLALGHYLEALADYDRVLLIAPEDTTAQFNRQIISQCLSQKNSALFSLLKFNKDMEGDHLDFLEEFKGKVVNRSNEHVFLPPYRVRNHHIYIEGGRFPVYCNDDSFLAMIESSDTERGISIPSALIHLRQYAASTDADAVLLYNLGCLEIQGGTVDAAEQAFSQALAADPLLAEAYYNKAVALLLQNKKDLAMPLLSKAGEMGIVKAFKLLNQVKNK